MCTSVFSFTNDIGSAPQQCYVAIKKLSHWFYFCLKTLVLIVDASVDGRHWLLTYAKWIISFMLYWVGACILEAGLTLTVFLPPWACYSVSVTHCSHLQICGNNGVWIPLCYCGDSLRCSMQSWERCIVKEMSIDWFCLALSSQDCSMQHKSLSLLEFLDLLTSPSPAG